MFNSYKIDLGNLAHFVGCKARARPPSCRFRDLS